MFRFLLLSRNATRRFLVLMLIKSNSQDWHCRMLVRNLYTYFMTRLMRDDSAQELRIQMRDLNYCKSESIQINGNAPSASALSTVKAPNRRRLDLENMVDLNETPNLKAATLPRNDERYTMGFEETAAGGSAKSSKDVSFRVPIADMDTI